MRAARPTIIQRGRSASNAAVHGAAEAAGKSNFGVKHAPGGGWVCIKGDQFAGAECEFMARTCCLPQLGQTPGKSDKWEDFFELVEGRLVSGLASWSWSPSASRLSWISSETQFLLPGGSAFSFDDALERSWLTASSGWQGHQGKTAERLVRITVTLAAPTTSSARPRLPNVLILVKDDRVIPNLLSLSIAVYIFPDLLTLATEVCSTHSCHRTNAYS